ncbi:unnamed protein product [Zymoseptoria tritici ST99CH_3D7]|uniref:Zn(2)-C6 fungal-type domain-containing protein n=1 Tax=Zymoseptoria tritici (strain ST99CH_3D7) TaxID=1276538 RepID=A0A1X7RLD8_ZYMT9|nr:unnamed protein product [Zymoseptoria tritici ST99CH_3D7]
MADTPKDETGKKVRTTSFFGQYHPGGAKNPDVRTQPKPSPSTSTSAAASTSSTPRKQQSRAEVSPPPRINGGHFTPRVPSKFAGAGSAKVKASGPSTASAPSGTSSTSPASPTSSTSPTTNAPSPGNMTVAAMAKETLELTSRLSRLAPDMASRSEKVEKEFEVLGRELKAALKEPDALRKELEAEKVESAAARVDAETARNEAKAAQTDLETSQAETSAARAETKLLKGEIDGVKANFEAARIEAESAQKDLKTSKAETTAVWAEFRSLQDEIFGVKTDAEAARINAESARKETDGLREELTAARAETHTAKLETATARNDGAVFRKQVRDAQKETDGMRAEVEAQRLKAETTAKEAEAQRQKTEIATNKAQIEQLRADTATKKVESERSKAETAVKEADALQLENNSLREAKEAAVANAETLRAENELLQEESAAAAADANTAREEAESRRKAVDLALENAGTLRTKLDDLQGRIKLCEEEKVTALAENTKLRQEVEDAQKQATTSLNDTGNARSDAKLAREEKEAALAEVAAMKLEIEGLRKDASVARDASQPAEEDENSLKAKLRDLEKQLGEKETARKKMKEGCIQRDARIKLHKEQLEEKEGLISGLTEKLATEGQKSRDLTEQLSRQEEAIQSLEDKSTQCESMAQNAAQTPTAAPELHTGKIVASPLKYTDPENRATIKATGPQVAPPDPRLSTSRTIPALPQWTIEEHDVMYYSSNKIRKMVNMLPPSKEKMEHLRPHQWALSAVSNRPKKPRDWWTKNNEIDSDEMVVFGEDEAPPEDAMCEVTQSQAMESIETTDDGAYARTPVHQQLNHSETRRIRETDSYRPSPQSPATQHSNKIQQYAPTHHRHDSITSFQAPRAPQAPQFPSKRRPVCVQCWQNDIWCTVANPDKPSCDSCTSRGVKCVFKRCGFGDSCKIDVHGCVYFHNKDYAEMFHPQNMEDGDLGQRGGTKYKRRAVSADRRGRKRARSPSPLIDALDIQEPTWADGWIRKSVCRYCWETSSFCEDIVNGACKPCRLADVQCERVRCFKGMSCQARNCPELHPGQVQQFGPQQRTIDGFFKSDDRTRKRYFEPRRDMRAIRADDEFREARKRLLQGGTTEDARPLGPLGEAAARAARIGSPDRGRTQVAQGAKDPRTRPERSLSSRALRRAQM